MKESFKKAKKVDGKLKESWKRVVRIFSKKILRNWKNSYLPRLVAGQLLIIKLTSGQLGFAATGTCLRPLDAAWFWYPYSMSFVGLLGIKSPSTNSVGLKIFWRTNVDSVFNFMDNFITVISTGRQRALCTIQSKDRLPGLPGRCRWQKESCRARSIPTQPNFLKTNYDRIYDIWVAWTLAIFAWR